MKTKIRGKLAILFGLVLIFSTAIAFIPTKTSYADDNTKINKPSESVAYTDATSIHLTVNITSQNKEGHSVTYNFDNDFVDSNIYDGGNQYDFKQGNCTSNITFAKGNKFDQTNATITLSAPDTTNGGACSSVNYQATVGNPGFGSVAFKWVSATEIDSIDGDFKLAEANNNPNIWTGSVNHAVVSVCAGQLDCHAWSGMSLQLNGQNSVGNSTGNAYFIADQSNDSSALPTMTASKANGGDYQEDKIMNGITVAGSPSNPIVSTTGNTNGNGDSADGGDGTEDTPELTCNVSPNPLTWLLCPMVKGMVNIIGQLDNFINSQLTTGTPGSSDDPDQIFCDQNSGGDGDANQTCGEYYQAWRTVRDLSLGVLTIVGLVIIISEAMGFELLDAYAFRKTLPRLLFAAVALTLSWPLLRFFVLFTNDLGLGIRSLIYAPFNGFTGTVSLGGGGETAVNLVGLGAITSLGIFGVLSFAATGAVAVFVAFLVLVIRQLLVILLLIFAPLAIVAYILPNTQRMYKLWWDSFGKALMMFPLISAFIAAGRVLAKVSTANSNNTVGQLIGFAAYFAPYFLIPLTFRFAGGLLSNIGGFVNDRHRGAFDRLKNFRGSQRQKNWENIKAGKRWQGNPVADRASHALQTATLLNSAGYKPSEMRKRMEGARSAQTTAYSRKKGSDSIYAQAVAGYDDVLQATLESDGSEAGIASWLEKERGMSSHEARQQAANVRLARRDMGTPAFEEWAHAQISGTKTGWQDADGGGDTSARAMRAIDRIAKGDTARAARMVSAHKSAAEHAQRIDLYGASFGTQMDMLAAIHADPGGTKVTDKDIMMTFARETLKSKSAGQIASSSHGAMAKIMPAVFESVAEAKKTVVDAEATYSVEMGAATTQAQRVAATEKLETARREEKRVLASTSALLDVAGQVSPENAQEVGKVMVQLTGKLIHDPTKDVYEMRQKLDMNGAPAIDRNTRSPVMERVKVSEGVKQETYGDLIESMEGDAVFKQFKKTYSSEKMQADMAGRSIDGSMGKPPGT